MKILVEIQNPIRDFQEYVAVMDDAIFTIDRDAVITVSLR